MPRRVGRYLEPSALRDHSCHGKPQTRMYFVVLTAQAYLMSRSRLWRILRPLKVIENEMRRTDTSGAVSLLRDMLHVGPLSRSFTLSINVQDEQ